MEAVHHTAMARGCHHVRHTAGRLDPRVAALQLCPRMNPLAVPVASRAALMAIFLATGCTNIKNDEARTKAEGALAGSAGGAVLGALVGALAGMGSPDYITRGALIGAGAGGGAGYAYGASVAYKKKQFATQEAYLDACIAEARQKTQKSRSYNALARAVIARQQQQLAALHRTGALARPRDPNVDALRTKLDESLTNLSLADQAWEYTLQAHQAVVQKTRASARTIELNSQLEALRQEKSIGEELILQFKTLKKQLPVATTPR
jgi:hypothetical protein